MTQTVVIIGAGFFGIWCANKLARSKKDYKVKLISKSDYAYFLLAAIRVSVGNDTDRSVYPLSEVLDESVEVIKDEVTLMTESSVLLKEVGEVEFDALIIATGAKWPDPISTTHKFGDDYQSYFAQEHKKIDEAKHIVLIGGGYNNAELAGEMHDRFKNQLKDGTKKITMIHSREDMLPADGFYCDKLRKRVTDFYQNETDIELILNTRAQFSENDPNHVIIGDRIIEADLIYHSTGVEASVPPHSFKEFTDDQGFIKVHETFQCTAISEGNVFAIGDCADFKYKGLVLRLSWINALLYNVDRVLEGSTIDSIDLKRCSRPAYHIPSLVSLGAHAGCGQFGFSWLPWTFLIPEWLARWKKSSDLGRSFAKWFFENGA